MITINDIEKHIKDMIQENGKYTLLDRLKLLKKMDTYIDQKDYSEEDIKKIQYLFYCYCHNGVKEEIVDIVNSKRSYEENNITFKNNIESVQYLNVLKKLLLLDKKRKTTLWSERSLYVLNFNDDTRNFLQENNYNTGKLEEISWSKLYKDISIDYKNNEKAKEKIEKVKKLCPNYLKKIDWSKLEMNSHLLVLLAKEYNHDFNQKQINEYLTCIKPTIEKDIQVRMDYFTTILSHSSFYKSNIIKWKDLKDGLGKFFNISMKGIKEYTEDLTVSQKFIFLLADNALLKHDNMKSKLEKNEKLNVFGKPYLNEEEEKEYLKYKEQRSVQTKVKKTKI